MPFKTLIYLILIIIVLSHPNAAFEYAYQGLYQWAVKMVPTLFPFMMISSVMINSGADLELGRMLEVLLKRFYKYSTYGLYAIFMGFFCGFPMGAKVVSELCEKGKLDTKQAQTILCFCNNIGPAYFMGIIIPILHSCGIKNTIPFVFGMYGIPAIYGMFLSHGFNYNKNEVSSSMITHLEHVPFTSGLKKVCVENTQALIVLGGYITFTNVFRIFLDIFPISENIKSVISGFLEVTQGVQVISASTLHPRQKVVWIMTALCFSGISCFMQTSSFLVKSKLSLATYVKHRIIITIISFAYYSFLLI